jgi:hypothetical protein
MIVTTPHFLLDTTERILKAAIYQVGIDHNAQQGDQIMVEPIGTTHDPVDGWPLQRWQLTYLEN